MPASEAAKELPAIEAAVRECLIGADENGFDCLDDRATRNGLRVPGGAYGIVDVLKSVGGLSEEQAWQRIQDAGMSPDNHGDDHHGTHGCLYGATVESNPAAVRAPEPVTVDARVDSAKQHGGKYAVYRGAHHADYAVTNEVKGMTLDSLELLRRQKFGAVCYDRWAMPGVAKRLGVDATKFVTQMDAVYAATAAALNIPVEKMLTVKK